MSSTTLTVIVTSPDGRTRTNVTLPTTQNVRQLIDKACEKFKIVEDRDRYSLKYGRETLLDPSIILRLSGLAPGAKLELVFDGRIGSRATPVMVALQYVGDRCSGVGKLTAEISPEWSLWSMLCRLETLSEGRLKLVLLDKDGKCLIPHMVIFGQEYFGMDKMIDTTLSSIGIAKGNCLVRMTHKKTDMSPELVHEVATKMVTTPSIAAETKAKPIMSKIDANSRHLPQSSATGNDQDRVSKKIERKVALFSLPSGETLQSAPDLPENYYKVGEAEFRAHLSNLQARTKALLDAPLVSRTKLLEKQRTELLTRHPTTTIRFRFPDQYLLEATFNSEETCDDLFDFIDVSLNRKDLRFTLFAGPPSRQLMRKDQTYLWQLDFVPAAIINLSWTEPTHSTMKIINADIGRRLISLPLAARVDEDLMERSSSSNPTPDPATISPQPQSKSPSSTTKPSWLKL